MDDIAKPVQAISDLDPKDWNDFRAAAHALLDQCVDRMANARALPWIPVPEAVKASYAVSAKGQGERTIAERLAAEVMPYATGNTHPGFFGWVHGTGLASGLLSEMVAATMNSNCGGRDHGMTYVERAVIDWARDILGYPKGASGVLVTGTSQATVIALAAARGVALGPDLRRDGMADQPRLTAYAGASAHSAIRKAIELLGIGHANFRSIPESSQGMDIAALRSAITKDRAEGALPFAVVGTAGSVDFGTFDDLNALAKVAADEKLWFHVDGAFGAWARLADAPWCRLVDGIELADSIACDFHKWMYVPYDCGLVLIRDEMLHRAAFAARPSYLAAQTAGLGGGDPWYCDYGIDLSRGSRALKVWTALETYGSAKLGAAITQNCLMAKHMAERITASNRMSLAAPVVSNLCVFTADKSLSPDAQSALNTKIAHRLQLEGTAVFSTTQSGGVVCLRAAISNHRTRLADVDAIIDAVIRAASQVTDG